MLNLKFVKIIADPCASHFQSSQTAGSSHGKWTTRGLPTRGLDNSWSRARPKKRKLSTQSRRWHPRVVQSASWQSASCPVTVHTHSSRSQIANYRLACSQITKNSWAGILLTSVVTRSLSAGDRCWCAVSAVPNAPTSVP